MASLEKYPKARKFSGIYYAIISILVTLVVQSTLYLFKASGLIPFFQGLLLALITAYVSGAIFGKRIAKTAPPYKLKCFLWGVLVIIVALPFYSLGLTYLFQLNHPSAILSNSKLSEFSALYLAILSYCAVLGLFLSILSGIAAIYFRDKLYPGYLMFIEKQNSKQLAPNEGDPK